MAFIHRILASKKRIRVNEKQIRTHLLLFDFFRRPSSSATTASSTFSSLILPSFYDSTFIDNSEYFQIKKIEGKGRGIIASKNIEANTILFVEKPIVSFRNLSFHSELLDEYCPNCFHKISLSSRASSHEYCCKRCKDEAFDQYRKLTDKLNLDPILEYSARSERKFVLIIIRMIAMSLLSGKNFQKYWYKVNNLCFAGTPTNNEIPSDWEKEYEMVKKAYMSILGDDSGNKIFKVLNTEWYARLIGTMHLNMMSIDPDIAIGCSSSILFYNGSLFNHSCHPNVEIGLKSLTNDHDRDVLKNVRKEIGSNDFENDNEEVEGEELLDSNSLGYFKTNRDVKIGEELVITYIDNNKDCVGKKSDLAFAYNILCNECGK